MFTADLLTLKFCSRISLCSLHGAFSANTCLVLPTKKKRKTTDLCKCYCLQSHSQWIAVSAPILLCYWICSLHTDIVTRHFRFTLLYLKIHYTQTALLSNKHSYYASITPLAPFHDLARRSQWGYWISMALDSNDHWKSVSDRAIRNTGKTW